MPSKRPIITLSTDFGLSDHFVAAMKGVIKTICPAAEIIDITHDLRPFDVAEAAFTFGQAWRWFPKGTIHAGVVDPGVGSSRRAILTEAGGHRFIGPDNGLFTTALNQPKSKTRVIVNSKFFVKPVSNTFHGRDIFAPCAAHLAKGASPAAFGNIVIDALRLSLDKPTQVSKRTWSGTILKVDRFGNCITSFRIDEFPWLATNPFVFSVGFEQCARLASHYSDCAFGELTAIAGSSGHIEFSIRESNAAKQLGVAAGAPVELTGWAKDDN